MLSSKTLNVIGIIGIIAGILFLLGMVGGKQEHYRIDGNRGAMLTYENYSEVVLNTPAYAAIRLHKENSDNGRKFVSDDGRFELFLGNDDSFRLVVDGEIRHTGVLFGDRVSPFHQIRNRLLYGYVLLTELKIIGL